MAFTGTLPLMPAATQTCTLHGRRALPISAGALAGRPLQFSSTPAASCGSQRSPARRSVAASSSMSRPVAVASLSEEVEVPAGHKRYETMVVLRPDLTDEERDVELAKFEAFLAKEGGTNVNAMVRGRQRLAYPIKKFWDGIYVLYDYVAPRKASQAVQKYLSTPIVGAEFNILRHMTFNR